MTLSVWIGLVGVWLLMVLGLGIVGFETTMVVLGIIRVVLAPGIAWNTLGFEDDTLSRYEKIVAGMMVSGVSITLGVFWIGVLGYPLSLYSILLWTLAVIIIGFVGRTIRG